MRLSFLPRLVNGPLYDPVVYIRVLNVRRALMLDCGHFQGISNRELIALEAVCISHTHMDHFMGFDAVLRTILHRDRPLDLYGPEGFIDKTLAKLRAYTWNLTETYPLEIRIHEVGEGRITCARARADKGFAVEERVVLPREGSIVAFHPRYRIDAAILDHRGIPCLAYTVREPFHVGIRRGAPEGKGYLPGPWLAQLKERILAGRLDETVRVRTARGGEDIPAGDLMEELTVRAPGQAIGYVTDIACTEANIERLEEVAKGVDLLFIETFYLDELRDQARKKGHLTAAQAGTIARSLGALRAVPMHISPRCHGSMDPFYREMGISPDGTLLGR
jgi:ribonuclease Z